GHRFGGWRSGRHVQTVLDVRHIETVRLWAVRARPVAARVEEANDVVIARTVGDDFAIDDRRAGVDVDVADQEIFVIVRERCSPQELAAGFIERPESAALAYVDDDVA